MERKQKLEEIKRLKNLKKKEIIDKMKRLKSVAGDDDLPVNIDDLDEDFDPKEYDRRMQVMQITLFLLDFYFLFSLSKYSTMIIIKKVQLRKKNLKYPMKNFKVQ